jgi:hypothetical protein
MNVNVQQNIYWRAFHFKPIKHAIAGELKHGSFVYS